MKVIATVRCDSNTAPSPEHSGGPCLDARHLPARPGVVAPLVLFFRQGRHVYARAPQASTRGAETDFCYHESASASIPPTAQRSLYTARTKPITHIEFPIFASVTVTPRFDEKMCTQFHFFYDFFIPRLDGDVFLHIFFRV